MGRVIEGGVMEEEGEEEEERGGRKEGGRMGGRKEHKQTGEMAVGQEKYGPRGTGACQ